MKIKYLGHACFKVTSNDYSIIIDPYVGINGFDDINDSANEVICSHGHADHAYVDGIRIIEGNSPFINEKIACFHDDANGSKRGKNDINILTCEDKRIVHLGDLGHMLDKEALDKLKGCDVLMIPVGGFYTIDGNEAVKLIEEINPKYVIPMHYKDGDLNMDVIADINEFLTIYHKDNLLLVRGYNKEIEL